MNQRRVASLFGPVEGQSVTGAKLLIAFDGH